MALTIIGRDVVDAATVRFTITVDVPVAALTATTGGKKKKLGKAALKAAIKSALKAQAT